MAKRLITGVSVILFAGNLIRKNIDSLTDDETLQLRQALTAIQSDDSNKGYQNLASFHGAPGRCQFPDGSPMACCIHGMPTFPQWHRLYVTEFEGLMQAKGLTFGIPYWDWTQTITELPHLFQDALYIDPSNSKALKNPFFEGPIKFSNSVTKRAIDSRLFEHPAEGQHTTLYNAILYALEQDNYCDFHVAFEVAHNTIHYLVGGRHEESMSSLGYTAYDPLFFIHHSNVDRLFAIWQELQKERGLPYDYSNCALEQFRKPMVPFSNEGNPINITKTHAVPSSTFNYHDLGYEYDDLTFNGMSISHLNKMIEDRKSHSRLFASFRLEGIKSSADIQVFVCLPSTSDRADDDCDHLAGHLFLLGGPLEMSWAFDRPYLFEITSTLDNLGLDHMTTFHIKIDARFINGTHLGDDLLWPAKIVHRPAKGHKDGEIRCLFCMLLYRITIIELLL